MYFYKIPSESSGSFLFFPPSQFWFDLKAQVSVICRLERCAKETHKINILFLLLENILFNFSWKKNFLLLEFFL